MVTAKLTTLTPVHVGSGDTLRKDFGYFQKGNRIGILDLQKVLDRIGESQIPALTSLIEQKRSVWELPALRTAQLEDLSTITATAIGGSRTTNELKTHYRTSLQGLCIPGTSIKGSIKTAIWESLTTDEFLNALRKEDLQNNKRQWDDDKIDKRLFGPDANTKSTRFLKVTDAAFGESLRPEMHEVGVYNYNVRDELWDFLPQKFYVETVPAKAQTQIRMKIDDIWLKENKAHYAQTWSQIATDFISNDLKLFCDRINNYTKRLIEMEFEELQKFHFGETEIEDNFFSALDPVYNEILEIQGQSKKAFIIRLGGHVGWTFTTGRWVKKPALGLQNEDKKQLRKTIQKRGNLDIGLWPKSRKMTTTGIPLGFVKIEFS